MKTIWLALLLAPAAQAGEGLQLAQLNVQGTLATASCGPARIALSGLTQTDASGHRNVMTPSGRITIQLGTKTLHVGQAEPFFLQDRTMLACVRTPRGDRLVVATFCDGRACEPAEYLLIDPVMGAITSRAACDQACAEKALNAPVPSPLREGPLL